MSGVVDQIESYFQDLGTRFRRNDDEIEVVYYGYPVAERYRVVYLEKADAVLVSSHGVAYPQSSQEEVVCRTVMAWNHENLGACWSFDKDQHAICADSTLYLAGQPFTSEQFGRYYNALVDQVRRKLPELLRLVVEEPPASLDPKVKAQLEQILQDRQPEDAGSTDSEDTDSDSRGT